MKIIFRTVVLAFALVTTSCGKETANTIADIFDEETEQIENRVLDIETVSDNVIIQGGTKIEGAPPTSNGAITLDLSDSGKTAFLDEGFDISLTSDSEITGAYIRFKSTDGSISDSYYDVNLEMNNTNEGGKLLGRRRYKKEVLNTSTLRNYETVLDVDFNANIEPGEFCYEVCVYDTNGNISNPKEVCLTVQNWGGKSDLIALWNLTEEGETYEGNLSTSMVGEPDCSQEASFACEQGGEYQAKYICYTIESVGLEIKEDGTYKLDSKESGRQINDANSSASCEAIYDDFRDDYISNGRWAFVSEGNRLVLIEYSYSELYRGESESGTFESGDAEILLDGTIELEGNRLKITEEYSEGLDIFFFEK